MPPRKLTAEEQAFVDHWSQRMFYFVKMMRRADLYIRTITRESWKVAYKKYANSGRVAGGEWKTWKREGKKDNWEPKLEDREAYIDHMQGLIEKHPLNSPINAAAVMFSSNGGMMCIQNVIVAEQPQRIQNKFEEEWHKLNNQDLEDTKEMRHGLKPFTLDSNPGETLNSTFNKAMQLSRTSSSPSISNVTAQDFNEDDTPFIRSREAPTKQIFPENWEPSEFIGETYFSKDDEDETGFIAFEVTGFSIHRKRTVYEIRYEGSIDSIRLTEQEFLGFIAEGVWV